jgi:hypothetical protein
MKEISTLNQVDVTILLNGDAFISQRKTSKITGIPLSTLNAWIKSGNGTLLKTNENNQLDGKSLIEVAKVGRSKYKQCNVFLDSILEAGVKAYMYDLAGYTLNASKCDSNLKLAIGNLNNEIIRAIKLTNSKHLAKLEKAQDLKIKVINEKIQEFDKSSFTDSGADSTMMEACKILSTNLDLNMSLVDFMEILRRNNWLGVGRCKAERNLPSQPKINYMRVISFSPQGSTTLIKPCGIVKLSKVITKWHEDYMKVKVIW